MEKLRNIIGWKPVDRLVMRLLSSLCMAALFFAAVTGMNFTDISAYAGVSLRSFVVAFAVCFVLLTAVTYPFRRKSLATDMKVLFGIFTFYAALTAWIAKDYWYSAGMAALFAALIWYCSKRGYMPERKLSKKQTLLLVGIAVAFFALLFGSYAVARYAGNKTPNYDFGIFCQMYYNMRRCFRPLTTVERDVLLSHFSVHMSPIYYAVLPFYAVLPSPVTLQLAQTVVLASSSVPLYLLCKKYELSNAKTVLLETALMLHPALFGGGAYDFHENCFLVPLLLWMFFFWEKRKIIPLAVFALLVCFVKEDAPVYVMFFALWALVTAENRKWRITGAALFAGAAVYFVAVLSWMAKYGDGIMAGRYSNFLSSPDDSLFSAIKNVLANPAYVFTQIFADSKGDHAPKILFLLQMLLPFAFLPVCVKKIQNLILLFPMLLINLMTMYVYQYDIGFQYVYGPFAFIIYLAVINTSAAGEGGLTALRIGAVASALLLLANYVPRTVGVLSEVSSAAADTALVNEYLDSIPEDASVCSSTYFIPRLSRRQALYEDFYHNPAEGERLDYILIDGRYDKSEFIEKYLGLGYEITETIRGEKGNILLTVLRPAGATG